MQFHPSYDYTDFVEGLRPTLPDSKGNIGFERKDGAFKEFCKRAISETSTNNSEDNVRTFERCFYELIDDIKNGKVKNIPLKSKKSETLNVTSNNTIKWQKKTNEESSANAVSLNRLLKLYPYYKTAKEVEDMENIDQTIRNIIGGANTTYYWGGCMRFCEEWKNVIQPRLLNLSSLICGFQAAQDVPNTILIALIVQKSS